MKIGFLIPAFLFLGFAARAENIPVGFDLQKFQLLINTAAEKGEPLQLDDYEYRVLTHLSPADITKPHKADYFSAMGGTDSAGHFGVAEVQAESEDWRKQADGNWYIEQWTWTAEPNGSLLTVDHGYVVETTDGAVEDLGNLPVGQPSDAAEISRWGAKVVEWYGFAR